MTAATPAAAISVAAKFRTITLQSDAPVQEALAGEAGIYPGMLVKRHTDGTVLKHAAAAGAAQALVALENDLKGDDVSTVYVISTMVQFRSFRKGDRVAVRLADGENVAIGDYVESAGTGYFRKVVDYASGAVVPLKGPVVVGTVLKALNMSDSSTVDPVDLCAIEIV